MRYSRFTFLTLALLLAVAGAYSVGGMNTIFLLREFNLVIHEAGHLLMANDGESHFLAGSGAQVFFPLALALFAAFKRHWAPVIFCVGWAGLSLIEVAVYVADAPYQNLPLVGGGIHDWAWLLTEWDSMDQAQKIASQMRTMAGVLVGASVAWALYFVMKPLRLPLPPGVVRPEKLHRKE